MAERLTPETIEGLRESNRKDIEAARLLDCAAGYVDPRVDTVQRCRERPRR